MKNKHSKYKRISFPTPLIDKVKNYNKDKPEYQDISEFIREAIREKMRNELIIDYEIKEKVKDKECVECTFEDNNKNIHKEKEEQLMFS